MNKDYIRMCNCKEVQDSFDPNEKHGSSSTYLLGPPKMSFCSCCYSRLHLVPSEHDSSIAALKCPECKKELWDTSVLRLNIPDILQLIKWMEEGAWQFCLRNHEKGACIGGFAVDSGNITFQEFDYCLESVMLRAWMFNMYDAVWDSEKSTWIKEIVDDI